jgi:peptide/nickel transport system substrate-binding protein
MVPQGIDDRTNWYLNVVSRIKVLGFRTPFLKEITMSIFVRLSRRSLGAALFGATALVVPLAASDAVHAQTLTIGVRGGPDSIDPHFTASGTHAEALKHVFDTLTWSGDGLEIEPRLAESWKVVNDTTWEFKLRKGVKFHDGSDFTAEDVKFSIERIPMVSGPNPTTIYTRRVKETRIIDAHTIQIVTDGPAPILPNDFIRLFIVSSKAAAGLTKESANEAFNTGKAAVGTGPYKFVSWQPKGDLVLVRRSRGRVTFARKSPTTPRASRSSRPASWI